jgi:hypothetical protein
MRKVAILVGLLSSAFTAAAAAQDGAPTGEPAGASLASSAALPAGWPTQRLELTAAVLPMVFGTIGGGQEVLFPSADAAVAFGVGVSVGYRIVSGLSVGLAPQILFNVKGDDDAESAATEYDLLARVAYAYPVLPRLTVYGELLPGYSVLSLPAHFRNVEGAAVDNPKGFVLVVGGGAALDLTDKLFVHLGIGYQVGFQRGSVGGRSFDYKTEFLRVSLGGGVRL